MIDPFDVTEAPIGEPTGIVAGQSAQWRREISIDPSLFSLTYRFRPKTGGASSQEIDMTSLSSSSEWGVDIEPADTSAWTTGDFFWDLVVIRTSDSREKIIDTGEMKVFGSDDDRRSHAAIMVAKIESILERRADDDVANYSIKSRSTTKMDISELREWREYYLRELNNQQLVDDGLFTKTGPNKSTVRVRFRH